MNVEIVHDEMPLDEAGLGLHAALNMSEKISFGAGGASRDLTDLTRGDLEIDHEGERAVPRVLELPTQTPSRLHGQVRMLGFQGLHARHFIGAHGRFSTLGPFLGGLVQLIDVGDLLRRLRVWLRGQVVAHQVRLETPFLSKRAAWRGEMYSTMP